MSLKSALTLALATVLWLGGCATRGPSVPPAPPVSATPTQEDQAASAPTEELPASPSVSAPERAEALREREIERGRASWYGPRFHGRRTASGEKFNMNDFTAAHKTLPFGTQVRVRHASTGREVVVRINDRGPFTKGRVIDLSRAAAESLGLIRAGTASVVLLAP